MTKKATCSKCNRRFTMGVNGVTNWPTGENLCDICAGVQRAPNGHAWLPDEQESAYLTSGGISIVSREEAMRQ